MAKKRRGRQLDRILRLIRKFTYTRSGVSIRELMDEFDSSRRTVYRDLDLLQRNGFRFDRSGGGAGDERKWSFTTGQRKEVSSTFSEVEMTSLYFALNVLSPLKGTPLRQGLESVLQKIESSFGPRDRERYGDLIFTHIAKASPSKSHVRSAATLAAVSRACLEKRKVALAYRAGADEKPKSYLFHPYCLAYYAGELYTVGHSELRKAVRTLRVDRIERCSPSQESFERPRDFDPEDYLGRGFGIYAEGELTTVKVEFSGPGAKAVREKEWHPSQRIAEKPGGKIVVTLQVQGIHEIARWVLYHAPYAKVVEPPELKEAVAELAVEVAKRHR